MNNSIYRISLDMQKNSSQVCLSAKEGDTSRSIHITLTENGKSYKIEDGCYAVFTATKPDGNKLFNDCIIKDNVIVYDFTEQTVSAVGQMHCEVTIYDLNGNKITSSFFDIVVHNVECNANDIVSSNEFAALISVTADARNIADDLETKRDEGYFNGEPGPQGPQGPQGEKGEKGDKGDKGDTPDLTNHIRIWQPNTEYKVGDIVLANGVFLGYRAYPETVVLKCNEKHTSSADPIFDGVYWDVVFDISANNSFSDHEGNIITETYATKEDLAEAIGLALEGDY